MNHAAAQSFDAFGDPSARNGAAATGDGITPLKPTTDGGAIPIGATSQVVVLFTNQSARPVQTGEINLYPSSNVSAAISLNQCALEPLQPSGQCAIALSVKGLQPGPWRVEMLMRHDGRTRLVTATLTGSVEGSAESADKLISDIETIPDEIDFGTLNASRSMIRSIVMRNITSVAVDIKSITIESNPQSGFSLRTDCTKLEAGQACLVTVTWSPIQKGPSSGVVVVQHNGPTGVASVALKGEYEPQAVSQAQVFPEAVPGLGLLVSSQEEVDFGSEIDSKSAITVSLVNIGDAPLTINDLLLAGSDNGLTVEKQGCTAGTVLDPIQACPLTLSWSPVRPGGLVDDIKIMHTGTRGTLVLPVRGESTGTVSKESQAIVLSGNPGLQLDEKLIPKEDRPGAELDAFDRPNVVDKAKLLDGFVVTSFAQNRAIIAGPSGSRVVFDREDVVFGGILWKVRLRSSGVEFSSGNEKVLLLFDKSLSTFKSGVSSSGSKSAPSTSSSGSGSDSSTASTQ